MTVNEYQIDNVLRMDFAVQDPATGEIVDADSLPTVEIFEDGGANPIRTPTPAKRDTDTPGQYTFSDTLSAANGYEVGKTYVVYAKATVGVAGGNVIMQFKIKATSPVIVYIG
jgi:hypothetical protein